MTDIYFEFQYAKLYEQMENGVACQWTYQGPEGEVTHLFIKREVPQKVDGETYFDLITPYGYGGPRVISVAEGYTKEDLTKAFERSFTQYCAENQIVSEFVRFYPLSDNGKDFAEVYNATLNRHTLGTNLKDYDDPVQAEFSKSCRKTIRGVLKQGVTFQMTQSPENLDEFIRIYYLNMERKQAEEFYFFEKSYFEDILRFFQDHVLLAEVKYEGKTIAAGLYFLTNNVIHAHLSGTDTEYLPLSPAYILKYGTALWGKEHGCSVIHYGGGVSSSTEDPLYCFKKKFAKNTEFPFYLGKKIWHVEAYQKLCQAAGVEPSGDFFPAYRAKHK